MNYTRDWIWSGLAVLALSGYVIFALSFVFSRGVCCADDANNAVAAKNLATGVGYATTMTQGPDRFSSRQFDPNVTTGPALVMPAALAVRVFGNVSWAPGLSFVICWTAILIAIGWRVRRFAPGAGFTLATVTFLFLCYSFTTLHYEQWFALLGEVPAALLLILGVLLYLGSATPRAGFAAGLVLALAVMAKLSALIGVSAALGTAGVLQWSGGARTVPSLTASFGRLWPMATGFVLPLVMFEAWKYSVLGPSIAGNAQDFWTYVVAQAASSHPGTGPLGAYDESLSALSERFRILLPDLVFGGAVVWWMIRHDRPLTRLFVVLASVVVVHSLWWLFLSIGWPRYFVFALPVIAFIFAMPLLVAVPDRRACLVYLLLLLLSSASGWTRLSLPMNRTTSSGGAPFVPTLPAKGLLEATDVLAPIAARRDVIVTQWWATGIDMEYALPTHGNFTHYKDAVAIGRGPYWIAVNTRFMDAKDQPFAAMLAACAEKKTFDVYLVAKCEGR